MRSDTRIASSKLYPRHGMKATSTFLPSASSPSSVHGPSPSTWPLCTFWPTRTIGFWVMQVLVGPLELGHRVDVGAHLLAGVFGLALDADDDALAVDVVDGAGSARHDDGPRIARRYL